MFRDLRMLAEMKKILIQNEKKTCFLISKNLMKKLAA
jgi:hypothetical protein